MDDESGMKARACDRCGIIYHIDEMNRDECNPKLIVCNKCNDKLPENRDRRDK